MGTRRWLCPAVAVICLAFGCGGVAPAAESPARAAPVEHTARAGQAPTPPRRPPALRAPPPSTPIDRVYFRRNDASINSPVTALDAVIALASKNPSLQFVLIGYAGATEDSPAQLSLRRANRVRDYLVRNGVSEQRIEVFAARTGVGVPTAGSRQFVSVGTR